jgi:NTP pyrophosphatase (non-canonical NTP hydrolase)
MNALGILRKLVRDTHSTFNTPNPDNEVQLICSALGLSGEAGEYTDLVKKTYEQGHEFNREKALRELGDVLYYCQLAAYALDTTLEEVIEVCRSKLAARYPDGFSTAASAGRKGE